MIVGKFNHKTMKTLIITAHPSKKGFTHKIARIISDITNGEIIDLYDEPVQEFLKFEDMGDIMIGEQTKSYQDKISEADILFFIHPIWWGNVPAILKNFCDLVFQAGFAFKYEEGKSAPVGLLKGKEAYIFMTSDAPGFIYSFVFTAVKKYWSHSFFGILPFCGIKVKKVEVFGGMRKSTEKIRKKWLDKVSKIIK